MIETELAAELQSAASLDPPLRRGVHLSRYRINLQTARINTLGNRAEDVFLICRTC